MSSSPAINSTTTPSPDNLSTTTPSWDNLSTTQLWSLTDEDLHIAYINNIVYYSFMVPIGLIGNVMTLTAVVMTLQVKRSMPTLLIGVLAANDLMSLLTFHLISVVSMAGGEYVGSRSLCLFQSMMTYTYLKIGCLTKFCISVDRCIALVRPLKYRHLVTKKRVIAIIIHNVLFGIITSLVTIIVDGEHVVMLPTSYQCVHGNWSQHNHYQLFIVVFDGVAFMSGVILFLFTNVTVIKVMITLGRQSQHMFKADLAEKSLEKKNGSQSSSNISTNSSGDIKFTDIMKTKSTNHEVPQSTNGLSKPDTVKPVSQPSEEKAKKNTDEKVDYEMKKKQQRQRKELKFAQLVTIIVTAFAVLWLPYMTVIFYEYHNKTDLFPLIEDIAIKLVLSNCCTNPIIYGVFNANFRGAYIYYLKLMAFCLSCKKTPKPSNKQMPWFKSGPRRYTNISTVELDTTRSVAANG